MKNLFLYFNCILILFTTYDLNAQSKSEVGEWSSPIQFGIVPVAVANLPDGRLLTWSSQFRNTFIEDGDGATFSQYFSPFLNNGSGGIDGPEFTINTDHDMFCPGINNLPDGRILSAGGTSSERTSIFDPLTGVWSVASDMNIPRGYQGNVTMSDGNVFTVGGSWNDYNSNNPDNPLRNGGKDAEIWSPTSGWVKLGNITGEDIWINDDLAQENQGLYRIDNHVWLWPAPNGKLFHAGPSEMMHWIDTDEDGGEIVEAGRRHDLNANIQDGHSMKGNTVMFDTGKILKTGGAPAYGDDNIISVPARDNSFVIDLNNVNYGDTPNVTFTGNMAKPRTMHNSTVLPNGEVLVTGGLEGAAVFTDESAVLGAEIFNETTGFRQVAAMHEARTYHSVAILMVDGRVFVGGGGLCDNTPECVDHFNAEIYSPPYLFDNSGNLAARPSITSVTGNTLGSGPYNNNPLVAYGDDLQVTTDVAVESFSLIRFSAATHSTNNEQRRIPLATTSGTSHSLTVPDRNLLPPGYYMLFAMDGNGVPSVASTIRIGTALPLNTNSNLVLDMQFDENTGSTSISDNSVNNNNGTVVERDDNGSSVSANSHQFVNGLFGNAIEFEGFEHNSHSLVDVPYSNSLESIEKQVTLSAWVWRDTDSGIPQLGGKIANVSVLAHNYLGSNGLFFGFHNTLYKWSFRTTNGYYDNYAGYAPLAGWNHIVATYDGASSKLYANGVLVGEVAASGDFILNGDTTSELSSFTISGFYDERTSAQLPGYANQSGITDEVNGKMDNVQVYNTVLGQEEIKNLFNEGLDTGEVLSGNCQGNYIALEYKINDGNWETNANNRIVATEGDEVFVRGLNYTGPYFVTTQLVDGPTLDSTTDFNAEGAYQIDTDRPGASSPFGDGILDIDDRGLYTMTTADGCPTSFFVEVLGSCDPGETEIFTEYNSNGPWIEGASEATLSAGNRLQLSILPNIDTNPESHPIQVILPNGNSVKDGYIINSLTTANEGRYIFISAQGCTKYLDVTIAEVDCSSLGLLTEYQINGGEYIEGAQSVNVDPGDDLRLSIRPNGNDFSVVSNSINGNNKVLSAQDLFINDIDQNDAGTYTFSSTGGCSVELTVNVTGSGNSSPVAVASSNVAGGTAPLSVNFDGSGSTGSGIATYSWDFGDGSTGSGMEVSHIYATDGIFDVELTVTDTQGLTGRDIVSVTVGFSVVGCGPLPDAWFGSDIGNVGVSGMDCYGSGVFDISGSGRDIWDSVDQFRYVYQQVSGDVEIIARVLDQENTHNWAKSGLMVRENLSSGSSHALLHVSPFPDGAGGPGYSYQYRSSEGSSMRLGGSIASLPGGTPHYLRMVREGDTISGYVSGTDSDWELVWAQHIPMSDTVYIGMAVNSHDNGRLGSASFDDVVLLRLSSKYFKSDKLMTLVPNPANIETTLSFNQTTTIDEIQIFDVSGKLVQTITGGMIDKRGAPVNVQEMPEGIYFVKTIDDTGVVFYKKMWIQR